MKIVALEEHFATPTMRDAWGRLPAERHDDGVAALDDQRVAQLEDLGEERLRSMDDVGVDVQVLSLTTPATQSLDGPDAVRLARSSNDLIAHAVAGSPDRFAGFATLPTPDPAAAAQELDRAVTELSLTGALLCGRTGERTMDQPEFSPIYEAAEALRVPLYVHPQLPVRAVRDAYYSGFGTATDAALAGGGIGWHYETGLQLLRLIVAGTLDRYPGLQLILGHWGEVVLFFLDRVESLDKAIKLQRPLRDYFRQNVYYTPSGIFSETYLQRTIQIVGIERVMFSTDYPFQYAGDGGARRFLERATLTTAEKELIAHGNWDRLTSR